MRHARGAHRCAGAEGEREGGLNSLDGGGEVTVPTPSDLVAVVVVSVSPVIREKEAGRKKQRTDGRKGGGAN